MILVTFQSRYFVDGFVNIPMPEHCIPTIGEWVVFDKKDVSDFFLEGSTIFTHWKIISKEIVFSKNAHYPNIVCTISANTKSEESFLIN